MASAYEKQAKKHLDPYRKKAVGDTLKLYQQEAKDTRKYYDNQIFEEGRAYEDQYRDNAVQKAINERQVAESMANLGLTDSGLNRTQQTAVALSAANNKAAIDRAKQQAIDNIELKKTSDLAAIRKGWLADKASINQTYDKYEQEYASELNNAAVKVGDGKPVGEFKIIANNNTLLNRGYEGNLSDNGVMVKTWIDSDGTEYTKYTDYNTGKSSTFLSTQNPYTGSINYDVEEGSFSSTKYQPTYVSVDKYGKWPSDKNDVVETLKLNEHASQYVPKKGKSQKIFETKNKNGEKQYWMWDGALNQYLEVYLDATDGKWKLKQ